ncbi:MAG TPA: hypothetical protein VMU83_06345 [Hanamia sp.]|nr:hypothetical protein [Hanamia sp.]
MENSKNDDLATNFQSCCEQYFIEKFQQNRYLYFEKLPYRYFGTEYKVEITMKNFDWLLEPKMAYDKYPGQGKNYGKSRCKFEQSCTINYIFKTNSLLESDRQIKTIKFYADTLEPFGKRISVTLIIDDLILTDKLRKIKLDIKMKFKIENIDESRKYLKLTYNSSSFTFKHIIPFWKEIIELNRHIFSKPF